MTEDSTRDTITKMFMVVDDDPAFLQLCEMLAGYSGESIEMVSFNNPVQALNELSTIQPDVLLLDIFMPQLDGWDFLQYIKGVDYINAVYIVTSSVDPQDRQRALKNPMVIDFIPKPLNKGKLRQIFSNT